MRSRLLAVSAALVAVGVLSASAQIRLEALKPAPPSLKTVPVPEPVGLSGFVRDRAAAIALGKALFWDVQVGGDGLVACASCHFHAGADHRTTGQLHPGANGDFDLAGPNHAAVRADYPFHQLAAPDDRGSKRVRSIDDVTGSQGVHARTFVDVALGGASDLVTGTGPDPLGFQVGSLNVRRVTGRNAPSVINAVFNIRNFWDGRANRRFNGRNPFGDSDPNARVLVVNDLGEVESRRVSIDRASLASQAVGPALSPVEMSASGRTFMKLGKKLLTLVPLGLQRVKADDSVLGRYASGTTGLTVSYPDLIRAAFQDRWWNAHTVVDASLNVVGGRSAPADGGGLSTDEYSMMEANFSLFWGLAIACYEATLVSNDAPYDRFQEGNRQALTPQQQFGMLVFLGRAGGNCIACHFSSEFTGATYDARLNPEEPGGPVLGVMERMFMGDGRPAVYDGGFYNIGVRPTSEDVGLGANDPFGSPLSFARLGQRAPGSVADDHLNPPLLSGERVTADGAFKTPSLRNVELTGPYFHNGSEASLQDVVRFYTRGGNFSDANPSDMDFAIVRQRGLIGHPNRQAALVDFLRGLTDERVRWSRAPFDHPELVTPNGAPGTEVSVLRDLGNPDQAQDAFATLPAVGRLGASTALRSFLDVPVFDGKPYPAPNPVYSGLALFATDTLNVATSANVSGDIWCGGNITLSSHLQHTFAGDVTAGGNVNVNGDTTVFEGSIMAKGRVTLSRTTTFRDGVAASNAEYFAPMAQQTLPAPPTLALARATVAVPGGGLVTLPPGRYGTVSIGPRGWLVLTNGVYVFDRLLMDAAAYLQYDADGTVDLPSLPLGEMPIRPLERTTLHVLSELTLARGVIISSGDALRSPHFKLYYHSKQAPITLPRDTYFHGTLVAPYATVTLSGRSNTQGGVYAKTILVSEGAVFRAHELVVLGLPFPGGAALTAGPIATTEADEREAPLGVTFALGQNAPNPMRSATRIVFTLPESRDVELRVFDVAGRSVRVLESGRLEPGIHSVEWDGTGEGGVRVSAGVYFYRLTAGADRAQRKLIVVE